MRIPTPNTGQLNPLFHTFAEFRPIVHRIVARQFTDWLVASAQFSPNVSGSNKHFNGGSYSYLKIHTGYIQTELMTSCPRQKNVKILYFWKKIIQLPCFSG